MIHADRHIYSDAGGRLLANQDGAAFLRYAPGDEITEADQAELAALAAPAEPDAGGEKELPKPADKARARPASKAGPA